LAVLSFVVMVVSIIFKYKNKNLRIVSAELSFLTTIAFAFWAANEDGALLYFGVAVYFVLSSILFLSLSEM